MGAPSRVIGVYKELPTAQRILEVAIAEIEAGGEAGLRIDAVARGAEITKPSIYHFYGSREGVVAAAQAERYRRLMLTGLEEAIELTKAASSREEFEALLPAYVDVVMGPDGAKRRAERIGVLGSAVSRPELTDEVAAATRQAVALTTELVAIPFDRGWATSDVDHEAMALWWLSHILGRHLFDLVDDDRLHEAWRDITLAQLRQLYFGDT